MNGGQLAIALPPPATSAESRAAGDRGIALTKARNSEWMGKALAALRGYASAHAEVAIEEFRVWWLANGGEMPTSHHAWGALGRSAARNGLLRFLRFQPAKSVATHGHPIRIYAGVVGG